MLSRLILASFMLVAVVLGDAEGEWSYEEEEPLGPSHWADAYKLCGDRKQSPIDISSPVPDGSLEEIKFQHYDVMPSIVRVKHDGHTIKVQPDVDMFISGGNLNGTFKFNHLHFHWGDNDTIGSEHTVEGHSYPLEMHFVHWNSGKYPNITEASKFVDGLAVLGLMAQVVPDNSTLLNEALGHLTESFGVIHYAGNETKTPSFKFQDLFPKNLQYYRYQGSLTTPPCLETVTWTVFKYPIFLTHNQAEEFRLFHEEHHPEREMHHSHRPVQPLNERNLFISPPYHAALSDGNPLGVMTSGASSLLSVLAYKLFS